MATFTGKAYFDGASFLSETKFRGASFSRLADFARATFSRKAEFCGATFSWVKFDGARFEEDAYFDSVTFTGETDFKNATFAAVSSFVNAEMKYTTSFEDTKFLLQPPKFLNTRLHQDTIWRGIKKWPTPTKTDKPGPFIDAYACLKLEMDRLKKHEDELDFFALELQSRRVLLGRWGWGLPIAIYGAFSDYGRSYIRPLVSLFYLALTGTLAFLSSDSLSPWQSLGLSFANSLNVFGFRKDFFEPAVIARLPAWLEVVAAIQTIFGTILLFLFGLGIRNKFRMK